MLYAKFADTLKSLSEWGIISADIARKNGLCDSVNIVFSDDSPLVEISIDDKIEIFDNDIRKFAGSICELPKEISGRSRRCRAVAKNAWADLEGIIYQQLWTTSKKDESGDSVVLSDVMRSKVVLGQDSEGNKLKVGGQIRDILEYAKQLGAQFEIGDIDADGDMLLDERTDLTCAEAILCSLRWLPNSQVYFDYSTEGLPTINVAQRKNLEIAEISEQNGDMLNLQIKARPDLKVNGVLIKYEHENTSGDLTWNSVEEDAYPESAKSGGKNVLVMSVDLVGFKEKVKIYHIECESILPDSTQWWRDHIPTLNGDFLILSTERNHPTLPRELVSGQIPEFISAKTEDDIVTAKVLMVDANGNKNEQNLSVSLTATTATTGDYPLYTTTQFKEPMPEGMAKAIYDATSDLHYQGTAIFAGLNAQNFIGKKISLKLSDNSVINSPVVSITEYLSKGLTKLEFGPPSHLYSDEMIDLFRINRNRLVPETYGPLSAGNSSEEREKTSLPESNTTQGNPAYSRIMLKVPEMDWSGTEGESATLQQIRPSIDLNPKDMISSTIEDPNSFPERSAKMRRVVMVKDGKIAYAYALLSEPEVLSDDTTEIF